MRRHKASRTAYKVALSILALGEKPGMEEVLPPGIVDATAGLLIASGAVGRRNVRWSRSQWMVSIYEAFDWMLPGQFEAFAYRKAFCERQVRKGIAAGATQVLVLGAGYDTMGWRLAPGFTGVNFFEIDHPATARLKAKGIAAMGRRGNLYLMAEDLGERKLADALGMSQCWDQSARTVVLAEGLLMYLSSEGVRDLFRQCAAIVGPGSRMAFTYIPAGNDGRPDAGRWTRLMLWLQRAIGEPWLWSIRPEELSPFLKKSGWNNAPESGKIHRKHGREFYALAVIDKRPDSE